MNISINEMNPRSSVLLTDLYQLTMLQAYFNEGMEDVAAFEFFVRKLPPKRGFFLRSEFRPEFPVGRL